MKKALFALIVSCCPLYLVAQKLSMALEAQVSAGADEGECTIGITLINKEEVVAIQLDMELPDSVSVVEVTKTRRTQDLILMSNRKKNGILRIIAYSQSGTPISGNSGEILIVNAEATTQSQSRGALHLRNIHLTLKGNKDTKLPDIEYSL